MRSGVGSDPSPLPFRETIAGLPSSMSWRFLRSFGSPLALIPIRPCQCFGLLQRLFAGQDIRSQPAAWQIVEIKEFGFPAVRKADLVAASVRHGRVPDDARHHSIMRATLPREFRPQDDLTLLIRLLHTPEFKNDGY